MNIKRKPTFMKKPVLKIALLSAVLAVILCVNSTYAWVSDHTDIIDNNFALKKVDITLVETFENDVKSDVFVQNDGEATVYVRVALVEQVLNTNNAIKANTTNESYFDYIGLPGDEWVQIGDYYYYKKPLLANENTSMLFKKATPKQDVKDNETLSLSVMTEGIQVNGIEVWDVTLDSAGNITGGTK